MTVVGEVGLVERWDSSIVKTVVIAIYEVSFVE